MHALPDPRTRISQATFQYGVFGGYGFGQCHVEAFHGMPGLNDTALLGLGLSADIADVRVLGVSQAMPELEICGGVLCPDIGMGEAAADLHVTALSLGSAPTLNARVVREAYRSAVAAVSNFFERNATSN